MNLFVLLNFEDRWSLKLIIFWRWRIHNLCGKFEDRKLCCRNWNLNSSIWIVCATISMSSNFLNCFSSKVVIAAPIANVFRNPFFKFVLDELIHILKCFKIVLHLKIMNYIIYHIFWINVKSITKFQLIEKIFRLRGNISNIPTGTD